MTQIPTPVLPALLSFPTWFFMEPSGAQFWEWETPRKPLSTRLRPPCSSSETKAPEAEVWPSLFPHVPWAPVKGGLGALLVPPVLPDCSARLQRPVCPFTLSQATWPSVPPPHSRQPLSGLASQLRPSQPQPPVLPSLALSLERGRGHAGLSRLSAVACPSSLFTPSWPEFLKIVCISVPPSPLQLDSSS